MNAASPRESAVASSRVHSVQPFCDARPNRFSDAKRSLLAGIGAVVLLVGRSAVGQPAEGGFHDTFGPRYSGRSGANASTLRHQPAGLGDALSRLRYWNDVALDANALDHTPIPEGENGLFGEQIGPARTARALAIVHIAIFEAINSFTSSYSSYVGLVPAVRPASLDAAIAQAAHDTLAALYPSQSASFGELLAADLERMPNGPGKKAGIAIGREAAALILALRSNDGSVHGEAHMGTDYVPGIEPGEWRQDPVSLIPVALGSHWGSVVPFALPSAAAFRPPPPPRLDSAEYAVAFNEVKSRGGDGVHTPTLRTQDQTEMGLFWAYDGTPGLGTPPRLYNQIAVQIAAQRHSNVLETARLLALLNTAMADAGITCWEAKYFYKFWRPIVGIRESDIGTGPTGAGDGNSATVGDPAFMPLGAPASNLMGPNFTPPFPAYPSGHATFGGAIFETLRRFYGTDAISFTFVSDELNGATLDNQNVVRPLRSRSFSSLSQAEEENGQSRIYLGIHWAFDKTAGIKQGREVADHVFDHLFVPIRKAAPPAR